MKPSSSVIKIPANYCTQPRLYSHHYMVKLTFLFHLSQAKGSLGVAIEIPEGLRDCEMLSFRNRPEWKLT